MFYGSGPAAVTNNTIENNSNPGASWDWAGGVYWQFAGSNEVFSDNVISGQPRDGGAALYLDYYGTISTWMAT